MRLVTALLFLATLLPGVHFPNSWRYAHTDARLMAGVDFHQLLKSPFGDAIREQIAQAGLAGVQGIEFVHDVDRVLVSSPGKRTPDQQTSAQVLVVLSGRFRLEALRKLAFGEGAAVQSYKSVEIIAPPKARSSDIHVALVDSQTLLLGDRLTVMVALDRGGAAMDQPSKDSLVARAKEMSDQNDIWVVGSGTLDDVAGGQIEQIPFAADVEGVQFGAALRAGLHLDFRLNTRSEESAKTIATALQMFLHHGLAKQPDQSAAVADVLKKLTVTLEDSDVHMALALDAAELESNFGRVRSAFTPPARGPIHLGGAVRSNVPMELNPAQISALVSEARPAAPPPPPAPPKRMTIRIEGAEDGPREIPYPSEPKPDAPKP